jgi:hypothetical protein
MTTTTANHQAFRTLAVLEARLRSLGIKIPPRRTRGAGSIVEAMTRFDEVIKALDSWFDTMVPLRDAITVAVNDMRHVMAESMNKEAKAKK